jgi:hypothetical protein
MARSLDIETLIENAFLSELPSYLDDDVSVIVWDDIKNKTLTPLVRIKASISEEQQGTMNLYCASNVIVDFGVFTSKTEDENGRKGNGIRGGIRDLINQSNIVDLLNATSGLAVYSNGVIPVSSTDVPDAKLRQKNLTILVVATTT